MQKNSLTMLPYTPQDTNQKANTINWRIESLLLTSCIVINTATRPINRKKNEWQILSMNVLNTIYSNKIIVATKT